MDTNLDSKKTWPITTNKIDSSVLLPALNLPNAMLQGECVGGGAFTQVRTPPLILSVSGKFYVVRQDLLDMDKVTIFIKLNKNGYG